jgi:hypothetical protein
MSVGLSTLKKILFDVGLRTRLTPLQLRVSRLLSLSSEYGFPTSKRAVLVRRLRERLLDDAKAQGEVNPDLDELEDEFLKETDTERFTSVVADALDRAGITAKSKVELTKAQSELLKSRRRIEELEKKLRASQDRERALLAKRSAKKRKKPLGGRRK